MSIQDSRTTARQRRTHSKRVRPATDEFAFERVVCLSFDIAVVHAAAQNFRLDLAKGFHSSPSNWLEYFEDYYDEAQEVLRTYTCNHFPGNNGEPWIHLAMSPGKLRADSSAACVLMELFNSIFSRDNLQLLDGEFYPDPRVCKDRLSIQRASDKFSKVYIHH